MVIELLDNPCLLAPEKGKQLANSIKKVLKNSPRVSIDFSGHQFLSSAFLNHAFGQLCIDLDLDTARFQKKVHIVGLEEDDSDELHLAIDNAQVRRSLIKKKISPKDYYATRIPA